MMPVGQRFSPSSHVGEMCDVASVQQCMYKDRVFFVLYLKKNPNKPETDELAIFKIGKLN